MVEEVLPGSSPGAAAGPPCGRTTRSSRSGTLPSCSSWRWRPRFAPSRSLRWSRPRFVCLFLDHLFIFIFYFYFDCLFFLREGSPVCLQLRGSTGGPRGLASIRMHPALRSIPGPPLLGCRLLVPGVARKRSFSWLFAAAACAHGGSAARDNAHECMHAYRREPIDNSLACPRQGPRYLRGRRGAPPPLVPALQAYFPRARGRVPHRWGPSMGLSSSCWGIHQLHLNGRGCHADRAERTNSCFAIIRPGAGTIMIPRGALLPGLGRLRRPGG